MRLKGLLSRFSSGRKSSVSQETQANKLRHKCNALSSDLQFLELAEQSLVYQGKESTSKITKLRLARELAGMRANIRRKQQLVQMYSQQREILSANAHNVEISKQATLTADISTEQLTENAVAAQEAIETLESQGLCDPVLLDDISDEEAAILKEFDAESEGAGEEAEILKEFESEPQEELQPNDSPPDIASTAIEAENAQRKQREGEVDSCPF